MMSSKNNGFTANDIGRYHSGEMPPEERHALEKAALEDPFLADALEGYAFTSSAANDLNKIQYRLNEQLNRKKTIPFFQQYKWISVAALFVIIVGTGWLVYNLSQKTNQSSVAVQEEREIKKSSPNSTYTQQQTNDSAVYSLTSADKKAIEDQQNKAPNKIEENKNNLTHQLARQDVAVGKIRSNRSNASYKNQSNYNTKNSAAPQNETGDTNGTLNKIELVKISGNDAALATSKLKVINGNNTKTDTVNMDFSGNQPATRARMIEQNDTNKPFDIVLQPLPKDSQPAMQEVVVGRGVERKSIDKYPKVTIDTLEPAEGYVHFDDYVISNLQMPEELKTKSISGGEVQLAFDVDENGQAINITVIKSLCAKCDEEAIRLLKEGPKWKKKKNKKGKITIEF